MQAVQDGDLEEFRRLLPTDPEERAAAVRVPGVLKEAANAGRHEILDQMLVWSPTLLTDLPQARRDEALVGTAYGLSRSASNADPATQARLDDQLAMFKRMLDIGANPDGIPSSSESMMTILLRARPVPQILAAAQLALQKGASLAQRPSATQAPLVEAARQKSVAILGVMIEHGRPTDSQLDDAIRVIEIEAGNPVIEPLLRARGSAKALPQQSPYPALSLAALLAREGKPETLRLILRYPVDDNPPPEAVTALELLVLNDEFRPLLLKAGSDPNRRSPGMGTMMNRTPKGGTALMAALYVPDEMLWAADPSARRRAVRDLVAANADPTIPDARGYTPVMETLEDEDEIVKMLFKRGMTISPPPRWTSGRTDATVPSGPIAWAVLHHKDALGAALVRGGSPRSLEDCGAIYYAALTGSARALRALLDAKAPGADVRDYKVGMTPLIAAAGSNHVETMRLLLDRRVAHIDEKVHRKTTLVSSPGGLIPFWETGGQTALIMAATNGQLEAVRFLVERRANLSVKDGTGRTAHDHATSPEIRRLLTPK